jgi:hypothetical protein
MYVGALVGEWLARVAGAHRLDGSLHCKGALRAYGSLFIYETVISAGSLRFFGALASGGLTSYSGALASTGSLRWECNYPSAWLARPTWRSLATRLASTTWCSPLLVAHSGWLVLSCTSGSFSGQVVLSRLMTRSSNMEPSSTKARLHPMAPWAVWLDRHCRTRLLRMLLSACLASSATTAPSSSRGSLSPVGPLNGAGSLLQLCCYQLAWLASRNWCPHVPRLACR